MLFLILLIFKLAVYHFLKWNVFTVIKKYWKNGEKILEKGFYPVSLTKGFYFD